MDEMEVVVKFRRVEKDGKTLWTAQEVLPDGSGALSQPHEASDLYYWVLAGLLTGR